ncbi:MAG: S16 family serine protease [Leptothrix sp. (in: b-proteobacteria)]
MSGPLHARGVLFEQTYGRVEGDSASLGELVALLSSLADAPVRQCLALTGSVDQYGLVQAIGAVNEKIEGFFDLCVQHGLDGTHGVLIPQANASQLMLREEVIEAVRSGRFTVQTVQTVDEALEALTGLLAGDLSDPSGDTVNGRVTRRLDEYARLRRREPRLLRSKAGRGRFVIERMGR